jgi:hypothetical protein
MTSVALALAFIAMLGVPALVAHRMIEAPHLAGAPVLPPIEEPQLD